MQGIRPIVMILEQDHKTQAKIAHEEKYFSFIASSIFEYCTKVKASQLCINVFYLVLILLLATYVKLCWVWISPFVLQFNCWFTN